MTMEEARTLFSDYIDGSLDDHQKDNFQAFLAANPEAAAELMQFERTLSIIHRLPSHEPTLDLWAEFAPRMAEYQADQKKRPFQRLRCQWADFQSSLSAGLIIYTQALAERTRTKLERYLLIDPLQDSENR